MTNEKDGVFPATGAPQGQRFKDYLAEQMRDPEFAAAYKEISAEVDAEFAITGAGEGTERKTDERIDRAWIAGAKFGWSCGDAGDNKRLNEAIRARLEDIADSKRATVAEGEDDEDCAIGCGCPDDPWNKPSTTTTGEGARKIETRLGMLPLSLIDDINGRRESIYRGWEYQVDPKIASQMKTDLDYLRAFVAALLPHHFPPTEATQVAVEAAAREIRDEFKRKFVIPTEQELIAIISKHVADAGEVRARAQLVGVMNCLAESQKQVERLRSELTTARANAIRAAIAEVHEMYAGSLWNIGRYADAVSGLLKRLERLEALESLSKGEGDDGPTEVQGGR